MKTLISRLPLVLILFHLVVNGQIVRPEKSEWDASPKDKYGGSTYVQLEATGYFRLERIDGKWWFITPVGHPFLAFGALHVGEYKLMQSYNKAHWIERLQLPRDATREDFAKAHRGLIKKEFNDLGLNWTGVGWTPAPNDNVTNYIYAARFVKVDYWRWPKAEDFPDVFDPEYVDYCDAFARREVLPRANDPRCIAFSLGDCPILIEQEGRPSERMIHRSAAPESPTWPRILRNKGGDSHGKRAYVESMQDMYKGSIGNFNHTYRTAFENWDELLAAENWRTDVDYRSNSREVRDNLHFLKKLLDHRYSIEVAAIRKYAPNHLICGDKFHQNAPLPDELFYLWDKHFDFIAVQFYGDWYDFEKIFDRLTQLTDKPLFSADSCWSVQRPPHQPFPRGPHCANDEIAAQMAREAFDGAFARPDVIGWGWCGWVDMRRKPDDTTSHPGYQNEFGKFYTPLTDEFKRFSSAMYGWHASGGQQ